MPRARQIKYGFFINEKLGELPPLCRLLFAGLWTIADREGKLEDRPKKIHAQLLPFDHDADVNGYLDALQDASLLRRYCVNDASFIQITNFCEHQNPHRSEADSTIPDEMTQEPEKHSISTVQEPEKHSTNPACNLGPDTNTKKEKTSKKKKSKKYVREQFQMVYKKYPIHKDKERAWIEFQKLNPSDELIEEILRAIENQIKEKQQKIKAKEFAAEWKYLATWLKQKCWTDEIEMPKLSRSIPTYCKKCGIQISSVLRPSGYCEECNQKIPITSQVSKAVANG